MGEPKLLVTKNAPLSPFVIDLSRRPAAPPVTLVHPVFDRSPLSLLNDLHVSFEDIAQQLEQEERHPMTLLSVVPLISKPAHAILWDEITQDAKQQFETLQLPESDSTTAETPEETLYTLDDVFERPIEPQPVQARRRLQLHPSWKRAVASFVGMSFIFVLPIQAMKQIERAKQTSAQVQMAGVAALSDLQLGAQALSENSYGLAKDDFTRAQKDFVSAQDALNQLSVLATTLGASAEGLIATGEHLANAAQLLSAAMNDVRGSTSGSLTTKLDILSQYLVRLDPEIAAAQQTLSSVNAKQVPASMQTQFTLLQSTLPELTQTLTQIKTSYSAIRTLLGADGPMRYLVLFQNNTELRPTGGFIGSYAEITFRDGAIDEINIPGGGSYDLQGSLTEFVQAPDPLKLINARFEFQDGNWFPDFPTSAQKLLWFYDHAGGPTVDGVIAVNATSVADLLSIVGAIDMPEYDRTIDSENFLFETQKIVENEYDKTQNRPKQFLADLAPRLLDRVEGDDTMTLLHVLKHVARTFETKEAQVYLRDPQLAKLIDALGWSGRVASTQGDYLMTVDSNLGGGKTDLVIKEDIEAHILINDDGTIDNTVSITREHKGLTGALFTGVNNVDYVRLYVPQGSTLISASGDFAAPATELFKQSNVPLAADDTVRLVSGATQQEPISGTRVNDEFGKTVFGNWMQTKPGSRSTITYTYRLPFRIASLSSDQSLLDRVKMAVGIAHVERYSLLVQKQSGALNRTVHVTLQASDKLKKLWASDEGIWSSEGVTFDNLTDNYLGLLFE